VIVIVAPGNALSGVTVVMPGAVSNVNPFGSVAVPPLQVTLTATGPAACAGVVALIVVADGAETPVAAAPPKSTVHPGAKFVPVNVTAVPPDVVPFEGATLVSVGAGTETVNPVNDALSVSGFVTTIVAAPLAMFGTTACNDAAFTNVTVGLAVPRNDTVAPF
jgi:hypothetical protein